MGYLVGDVLIAAAFLSYMGPFLSNYREELVTNKWMAEVSGGGLLLFLLFFTSINSVTIIGILMIITQ